MSLDDITDDQWDALEEIAGGWVGLLRGSALRAFLALRPEQVRPWQPGDVVGPLLTAPTDDESEPAPVGEATIDWDELAAELWDRLPRPIMRADYPGALRAVVGPLLAPAGGETVTVDEAMRISREVAEAVLAAPDHEFRSVNGLPDDDECTYRSDGTDATYCGRPARDHEPPATTDPDRVAKDEGSEPETVGVATGNRVAKAMPPVKDIAREVWDVWEDDEECDYTDAFVRVVGPVLDRLTAAAAVEWHDAEAAGISDGFIVRGPIGMIPFGGSFVPVRVAVELLADEGSDKDG
jgi:hypothetical protein